MATAALSRRFVPGDRKTVLFTITMSSSYTTGGETLDLTAAPVNLSTVDEIDIFPTGGYTFQYVGGKVKAWVSGNTEVTSTTNLSALPIVARAIGKPNN